ncbi:hypothetical protein OCQ_29590 [Mycobacterium paraintracellulare]|nr:hypothetical protein OCQ_29590 [Mycobacterium paraintracellulare]
MAYCDKPDLLTIAMGGSFTTMSAKSELDRIGHHIADEA